MRILNSEVFEIYRGEELVLPNLLGLGWCRTDYPRLGGPRTDGRIGFEVGYIDRGSVEWLNDTGLDEAGPGSVVLDWPGDWQGGVSAIVHPCERYWVRFNFRPAGSLPWLPERTVAALEAAFLDMRVRHFPASPQMKSYFQQLVGQQRAPGAFAEDVSRAAFHQILFLVVHDYQRGQRIAHSAMVRQALEIFDTHVAEDCRVEEVARRLDVSVGYFHQLFAREVGVTPAQYHLSKRIAAAKRELIYSDTSITTLSLGLGFSSSQYFATAFKKVVGLSPGEYRTLREGAMHTCSPPLGAPAYSGPQPAAGEPLSTTTR